MKEAILYYSGETLENKIKELKEKLKSATTEEKQFLESDIKKYELGLKGEKKILYELKHSHVPMYILHDLNITYKNYSAQIDYVIFTRKNCFIFESKSLFGNILIDENGDFFRVYNRKKTALYSPITQLNRHVDIIKQFIYDESGLVGKLFIKSNFDNYYRDAVVLTNELTQIKCLYPEYKNKVIRLDKVVDYIKKEDKYSHNLPDSEGKIKEMCDKLISLTNNNVNDEVNTTELNIDEDIYNLNELLKNKLKKYRYNKAVSLKYKPYFIFNDKTLNDLVKKKPSNLDELKNVIGISSIKINKYGKDILRIINS
jgi:hypothetical protein